jgi:hypothetical protein
MPDRHVDVSSTQVGPHDWQSDMVQISRCIMRNCATSRLFGDRFRSGLVLILRTCISFISDVRYIALRS